MNGAGGGVCCGAAPATGAEAGCESDPLSGRSASAALASRGELALLAAMAVALEPAATGFSRTIAVRNGLLGIVAPVTQPPSVATRSKVAERSPSASALLEIAQSVVARVIGGTRHLRQA